MKHIEIVGAKQNNLKSVNLKIPLGSFTVFCGPSGSGKSSLAFETLFAEGQRHYTQTLSNYARQYIQELPKPLVQCINNIPPSLALEQKNAVRSSRPTVATLTDMAGFLRLLFTHLGSVLCPEHKEPLCSYSPAGASKKVQKIFSDGKGIISVPIHPAHTGLSSRILKKKLLQEGWRHIGWKDKRKKKGFPIIRKLDSSLKIPTEKEIYIVLDRLDFKDLERLTDSLKLAYKVFLRYNKTAKAGKAAIFTLDNKNLILSETPACLFCAYEFPYPLQTSLFNFNSSLGACPACRGFGNHLTLDEKKVIPHPEKSLAEGALVPFTMPSTVAELRSLKQFCRHQNIDIHCPWKNLSVRNKRKIWKGSSSFIGVEGFFNYLETKKYKMHVRVFLARYKSSVTCLVCKGKRLRKEVSHIVFREKTLPDMLSMDIGTLKDFFQTLTLTKEEKKKAGEIVQKISFILEGLCGMGLDYLHLDRLVKTLSSGEFQRVNLVHQLGLGLSQVLYVLDEPTVGLHSKDTLRLIHLLKKLKQEGNTVVVVEHDPDMIKQAEFIVELGPGSGVKGGEIIFAGEREKFLKCTSSLTRSYLMKKRKQEIQGNLPVDLKKYKYFLEISGCRAHNLKNVCLSVPLHRLVTVTGVSGSGKSTLVSRTLYPALARGLGYKVPEGHPYKSLKGEQYLRQVVWINSSPVEKTRRSLPVTYLKIYDQIRSLMVFHCDKQKKLHIKPGIFSLNVEGGRCPFCQGLGYREIEMVFMDPVRVPCEECQGKRFRPEILNLKWKNKNIHQILNMTVAQASDFFVSWPSIWKPLSLLKKVGLDYLLLGQNLSTLSGGESQRLKLARELLNSKKNTFYILDEPTLGLHFQEVELLLALLRDLVNRGDSVLLIEHNLELIRQSDYLIDMGPGAGPKGGRILAQGTPKELMASSSGVTAQGLRKSKEN
ncbi:MAG: excinuclease ABC subunit UvrA [Bdellovibrionales bacterium]|nr:excinuclease ABC subunit UvrA [Bdellovibrionales bacterium]